MTRETEDAEFVTIERATEPGQFYVPRASEIASGERVLAAGEEITAARAAVPYLEQALTENAVVDLVPLAANARKSIEGAIADFRKSADGVNVDAAVTDLRLVDIEFDAKTLRVIAEADGTVKVAVTKLADK